MQIEYIEARARNPYCGSMLLIDPSEKSLIAAAPDLLAALKELASEEWRDDDDPILARARLNARAAIAKATGK